MANKDQVLKALAGLMDTEPKALDMKFVIINPSGQGSWLAATDIGMNVKLIGNPGDSPADALRNLFDKLTARRGYQEDSQVQVALEMMVTGKSVDDLFSAAAGTLAALPASRAAVRHMDAFHAEAEAENWKDEQLEDLGIDPDE